MLTPLLRSLGGEPQAELSFRERKIVAPTADTPVFICLAGVLLFTVIVAWIFIQLARPVVLPNAGMAGFQREWRVARPILQATSSQDAERAAVDVASHENELLVETTSVIPDQQAQPSSRAVVAVARPPKHGRVAKARARYAPQQWYNVWAYAPYQNGARLSGRAGLWPR